ncbi:MAG: ATP phosphoribosyltransferase regulatory subunit, partial [Candidatus Thermoplasmatota archaeon]
CEIIGADTPEGHAELISLAYQILKNLDLKKFTLKIGNLNLLSSIFKKMKITKQQREYLHPLIDKQEFGDVKEALLDFGYNDDEINDFIDILKTSDIKKVEEYLKKDKKALEEIDKTKVIFRLLEECYGVDKNKFRMSIVRGLDYYKGLVFEIDAPSLGAESQILGGGSYELVPLFGGNKVSTAGFAVGFDRTILALKKEGKMFPKPKIDAFVVPIDEKMIKHSIEIAQILREKGLCLDIDLRRRGIGKALKHANSIDSKKAVIVGPREVGKESVTLRDMKTGDQQMIKIKDLNKNLFQP